MPSYDNARTDAMIAELRPQFLKAFSVQDPLDVQWMTFGFAPGRINLIGEHVDYMGGYVCPGAVKEGCHILAGRVPHFFLTKEERIQFAQHEGHKVSWWRVVERHRLNQKVEEVRDRNTVMSSDTGLDKDVVMRFATTKGEYFELTQAVLDETEGIISGKIPRPADSGDKNWTTFIIGAVSLVLKNMGNKKLKDVWPRASGVCVLIHGTLPIGSGMSASASLDVALLYTIHAIVHNLFMTFGGNVDRTTTMHSSSWLTFSLRGSSPAAAGSPQERKYPLIRLRPEQRVHAAQDAQLIETKYCGVNVGIMDPFASVFSESNHFLCVNCDTLDFSLHNLERILGRDGTLLLINSMVKHTLAGSGYNTVRSDAEGAEAAIRKRAGKKFSFSSLVHNPDQFTKDGDVVAYFKSFKADMSQGEYERGLYNVEEQKRTLDFIQLASDKIKNKAAPPVSKKEEREEWRFREAGRLLSETHNGLRDFVKVSTPELDFIQERVCAVDGVAGARMMGGGFGGCVLVILKKQAVDRAISEVQHAFKEKFNLIPETYPADIGDGAFVVSLAQLTDLERRQYLSVHGPKKTGGSKL